MKETAYLLQAALISAWWIGLASSADFFNAFQFAEISSIAFWSFFTPDMILIAGLSVVRAYRKCDAFEYVILGAFGYASLYCCNATALTASGYLPTGLMLAGLSYNLFLCFNQSLFRSSSSSRTWNFVKTGVQTTCIYIISLVLIPGIILDAFNADLLPGFGIELWFGCGLFIGCSFLGLTSAFFIVREGGGTPLPLDQTNYLVVSGPYRYVRNPMAVAGIGQGLAIAIVFWSIPILIYSIIGALVWHVVVRPIEERDMVERFGVAYEDYRRRVSCWIPTFRSNVS